LIHSTLIRKSTLLRHHTGEVFAPARLVWDGLEHLAVMNTERLSGLGLEPVLTTSELAEYLGVHVQAIYDLRTDGRGLRLRPRPTLATKLTVELRPWRLSRTQEGRRYCRRPIPAILAELRGESGGAGCRGRRQ
jgi:hypothetical protein